MIDIISAFDFVISMRMHSMIFAALAGVPFAAISRIDKVDNFLNLFDLKSSGTVDDCRDDKLTLSVEDMLKNRKEYLDKVERRLPALRLETVKNEDTLKRVISGSKQRKRFTFSFLHSFLYGILFYGRFGPWLRREKTVTSTLRSLIKSLKGKKK